MSGLSFEGDPVHRATIEQAAEWFVRHRAGELSASQKDEFLAWLRRSPLNTREYIAIAAARRDLRVALSRLSLNEEALSSVVPLNLHTVRRPREKWRMFAGAATVLLIGAYLIHAFAGGSRIELPRGEQRTMVLRDGSVLHVNAESEVNVRYSERERAIELDKGQIFVEVAHDPSRPLRVRIGNTDVVALGTQFDVYRHGSQAITVTVVQGKVEIRRDASPPLQLVAGEQISLGETEATPAIAAVDAGSATAWVRREIVFERRPLSEVSEEFNRYIPVPVTIANPALRERLVSGRFNAYDTESFLVYLQRQGATVDKKRDEISVR